MTIRSFSLYTSGIIEENILMTDALKYSVIPLFPPRKEQEEQAFSAAYYKKIVVLQNLLQWSDWEKGKREMELMEPTTTAIEIV